MPAAPAFTPPAHAGPGCHLCEEAGGVLLWSDVEWRLIRVEDADFPAFYRVIHHQHVAEFSALGADQRRRCMDLVAAVDRVLVQQLRPTKVNLAALGNVVPHLHWHVIPRFRDDKHFPNPIWGPPQRAGEPPRIVDLADKLRTAFQEALGTSFPS